MNFSQLDARKKQILLSMASIMVMASTLSACTSSNTSDVLQSAAGDKKTVEEQVVDLRAYCPKTQVRAGTETLYIYEKGVKSTDENRSRKVRFQGFIREVVRECNAIAQTMSIRVGVAGRLINGAGGESGTVKLPIRIAVTQGDKVLYSQLHEQEVTLEPGKGFVAFRFVDENVLIDKPEKENVVIYVGFDEGPPKKKKRR